MSETSLVCCPVSQEVGNTGGHNHHNQPAKLQKLIIFAPNSKHKKQKIEKLQAGA